MQTYILVFVIEEKISKQRCNRAFAEESFLGSNHKEHSKCYVIIMLSDWPYFYDWKMIWPRAMKYAIEYSHLNISIEVQILLNCGLHHIGRF